MNKYASLPPQKVVTLCRNSRCCPTASISDSGVVLRDDFNGVVSLSHKEMGVLLEEYAAHRQSTKKGFVTTATCVGL
jgi:hypothetical protein